MPELRSRTVTHGRNMAGARALMQASGVAREDFGKPIIAVANSFTEFVPGHTHLQPVGRIVSEAIKAAGGIPREFNTIAVDDGIAMGHGGMLYSLPSRDLIADSVEYMTEAHCADALICISNCDKITPGMLMAAMRLNIPTVFVSGGPMEAGRATLVNGTVRKLDLIDAMSEAANDKRLRRGHAPHRGERLSDLRLLFRHVHRQLDELPDRGHRPGPARQRLGAGHPHRPQGAVRDGGPYGRRASPSATTSRTTRPSCRATSARRAAFENAMALDIAMGGSTNTILHLLAAAQEAGARLHHGGHRRALAHAALPDQGRAQRRARRHVLHGGRAPRRRHPRHPGRAVPRRAAERGRAHRARRLAWPTGSRPGTSAAARPPPRRWSCSTPRPAASAPPTAFSQSERWDVPRHRRRGRLHPRRRARLLRARAAWPCCTATSPRTAAS